MYMSTTDKNERNEATKNYLSNLGKRELIIMTFLYKSLENGWTIRKSNDVFILKKKHCEQREVLDTNYLTSFMNENLDIKEVDKWINKLSKSE